jgi:hypothetical protein
MPTGEFYALSIRDTKPAAWDYKVEGQEATLQNIADVLVAQLILRSLKPTSRTETEYRTDLKRNTVNRDRWKRILPEEEATTAYYGLMNPNRFRCSLWTWPSSVLMLMTG